MIDKQSSNLVKTENNNVDKDKQLMELKRKKLRISAKLLQKLHPKHHNHTYFPPSIWKFFCLFFIPLCCFVPPIVFTWLNDCLNNTPLEKYIALSFYEFAFIVAWIHWIVYCFVVKSCSIESRFTQCVHATALFSFMGCSLVWSDFVAYNPIYYWYIPSLVGSFAAFIEYFSTVSLQHKKRHCNLGSRLHKECNKRVVCRVRYHDLFDTLSCLFFITWITYTVSAAALSPSLILPSSRTSLLEYGCLSIPTPAPTPF